MLRYIPDLKNEELSNQCDVAQQLHSVVYKRGHLMNHCVLQCKHGTCNSVLGHGL